MLNSEGTSVQSPKFSCVIMYTSVHLHVTLALLVFQPNITRRGMRTVVDGGVIVVGFLRLELLTPYK